MALEFTTQNNLDLPKKFGPASLRAEKGLFIMDVEGEFGEIGGQIAELSKGITDDYIMRYFRYLPEKLISHSIASHISVLIPPRLSNALYSLFYKRNKKNIGPKFEQYMESYCKAFDVDPREGLKTILFPDILHWLAGKSFTPMAMHHGCSGFFARGAASKDGKVIVGRNFDFYGRGIWNASQSITVVRNKGAVPYFWIGTLGVPFGGFAMNEAGICLMPFTNFCKDVSMKGQTLFSMVVEILETARNLDDAVRIVQSKDRIASLSFLLIDRAARDARVVGFSAHRTEVLNPVDDFLIRTNHYITDNMKETEVASFAWNRHSTARYTRLEQLIKENYGAVTPELAVKFMSDNFDPFEGRRRTVGDIVAATNNSMSIVLDSDNDSLYIAHGDYPVCQSDKFLGFSVKGIFKKGGSAALPNDLEGGKQLDENEKRALAHYEEA
ncbi:MAG TPA: C45 family autoproteolytic acyltransferase/hydrolase, partial [bacterium]|nr:C45 family autoproteolytic acyltransferase/hydrolase [bacterium]